MNTAATSDPSPPQTFDARERAIYGAYAFFSRESRGRRHDEPVHPYRGPFQRDRDRILHSAAFRRLSHKMQVFTGDMGDYHRTRLTHTMEVASIARTLARALRLNEDLVEALAYLHDIGHPPFGHAGEDALAACLSDDGGFSHNQFALTLVEELEVRHAPYPGLNLSEEVLSGQWERIDKSGATKSRPPLLEVQLVDLADSITYNAHDVDDALKLGLLDYDELLQVPLARRADPSQLRDPEVRRRGLVHALVDLQVSSVWEQCAATLFAADWTDWEAPLEAGYRLAVTPEMQEQKATLEAFLYQRVYRHDQLLHVRQRAQGQLAQLFDYFSASGDRLPSTFAERASRVGLKRATADYLAGMTDRFCQKTWQVLFGEA